MDNELEKELGDLLFKTVKINCSRGIIIDLSEFIKKVIEEYDIRKKPTENLIKE